MEKIKQFLESEKGKDILVVLIVILVGLASFGLGRLSKNALIGTPGIKIEYKDIVPAQSSQKGSIEGQLRANVASTLNDPNSGGKAFFGSSKGTKYYGVSCAGGKAIKIENRIYFNSASEAEGKGYTLATSCQ